MIDIEKKLLFPVIIEFDKKVESANMYPQISMFVFTARYQGNRWVFILYDQFKPGYYEKRNVLSGCKYRVMRKYILQSFKNDFQYTDRFWSRLP